MTIAASAVSIGQGTKRNFVAEGGISESLGDGEEFRDELVLDEDVDTWRS